MLRHTGDLPEFGSLSETVRDLLRVATNQGLGFLFDVVATIIATILKVVVRAVSDILLELVRNSTTSFSFVRNPSSP